MGCCGGCRRVLNCVVGLGWHPLNAQVNIIGAKVLSIEVLLGEIRRYYVIVCDVGALILVEQLYTLHITVVLKNLSTTE